MILHGNAWNQNSLIFKLVAVFSGAENLSAVSKSTLRRCLGQIDRSVVLHLKLHASFPLAYTIVQAYKMTANTLCAIKLFCALT